MGVGLENRVPKKRVFPVPTTRGGAAGEEDAASELGHRRVRGRAQGEYELGGESSVADETGRDQPRMDLVHVAGGLAVPEVSERGLYRVPWLVRV